jgi:hypothetical protein
MSSSLARDLGVALDPARLFRALGMSPDPWQEELLRGRPERALMLCCRQAGKSVTAACASLHEALYRPGSLILMIAPSQRQSAELLRTTRTFLSVLPVKVAIRAESATLLELTNGSRIASLPAREDTIRGFSSVALIVIDEAARVPDELYFALRPMLAVSEGRLLALSTPNGQRGWFHDACHAAEGWRTVTVTAAQCPRISEAFLDEERQNMTPSFFASEYECTFSDAIEAVFTSADITAALDPETAALFKGGW